MAIPMQGNGIMALRKGRAHFVFIMETLMKGILIRMFLMDMEFIPFQMATCMKDNFQKGFNMEEGYIVMLELVLTKANGLMEEKEGED